MSVNKRWNMIEIQFHVTLKYYLDQEKCCLTDSRYLLRMYLLHPNWKETLCDCLTKTFKGAVSRCYCTSNCASGKEIPIINIIIYFHVYVFTFLKIMFLFASLIFVTGGPSYWCNPKLCDVEKSKSREFDIVPVVFLSWSLSVLNWLNVQVVSDLIGISAAWLRWKIHKNR